MLATPDLTHKCTHTPPLPTLHTESSFLNSSDTIYAFFLFSHKPNTPSSFFLIVDLWFIWCAKEKLTSLAALPSENVHAHTLDLSQKALMEQQRRFSLCNYNTCKPSLPSEADLSPSRDLYVLSSSCATPFFTPCCVWVLPPSVCKNHKTKLTSVREIGWKRWLQVSELIWVIWATESSKRLNSNTK